jgi:hypothetical protein
LKDQIGTLANNAERLVGWNWLGYHVDQVSGLGYCDPDATPEELDKNWCVPALLVWSTSRYNDYVWLVLDERDKIRDRVYDICTEVHVIIGPDGDEGDKVYLGWVEWLRYVWNKMETAANSNNLSCRGEDRSLEFDEFPTDSWQVARSDSECKFCSVFSASETLLNGGVFDQDAAMFCTCRRILAVYIVAVRYYRSNATGLWYRCEEVEFGRDQDSCKGKFGEWDAAIWRST